MDHEEFNRRSMKALSLFGQSKIYAPQKIVLEIYDALAQLHLGFKQDGNYKYRLQTAAKMLRNVAVWIDSLADSIEAA